VAIFTGPETCGWRVGRVEDGSVHVEPIGDLVDHEVLDCVCGPKTEPVVADDGSIGWLITHHSLDGRENSERSGET
jgi:hypothetical protein